LLFNRVKIGLALGGGGARGLAHIGVLQVLEKEKIPIDFIAGASAGSLVGAFYALYQDSKRLREAAQKLSDKMNENPGQFDIGFSQAEEGKKYLFWRKLTEFIKKGYYLHTELSKTCLNEGMMMREVLTELFGDRQFSDTKIPFCAVAADLVSGKEVILKEGLLREAIMASCTIPGVFPPVEYNGKLLVDGGIVNAVPIKIVREMGADFIIASNLSRELKRKKDFRNAIDIMLRSDAITSGKLRKIQLNTADFVITPKIQHINWWNFSKPEQCIKSGERAAEKEIEELLKILRKKRIKTNWNKLWSKT
jgi:NTE family protein